MRDGISTIYVMLLNIIFYGVLLLAPHSQAQIYKWTDENGKVHYGDSARGNKPTDAESVLIKDKYAVPVTKEITPIRYEGSEPTRTVVLSNITLDLPGSDEKDVLIGRVTCGRPVDIYWQNGYVRLERKYIGPQVIEILEENNYSARVGDAVREAGELSLTAKIKRIFMNTCAKNNHRGTSQDSTYVKIEWTLYDPLKDKNVVIFETRGSHNGMQSKSVTDGRAKSFDSAFNMSVINTLSNELFVQALSEEVDVEIEEDRSEEVDLSLNYSGKLGSFEDNAEYLKNRTVIVKSDGGHGSGVFIASEGYILTNAHVVGDLDTFSIESGVGNYTARLIKKNERRDVALLKIDNVKLAPKPVSISKSPSGIGEELYVIGTPLDMKFSHTITKGIVSAKRKMRNMEYLQTDAAINFGNSGGPVFNKKGDLVAITVSSLMTREGASLNINYLIPIDDALEQLNVAPKLSPTSLIKRFVGGDDKYGSSLEGSVLRRIYQWLNEPVYQL